MALECTDIETVINEIRLEQHWREDGLGKPEEVLDHFKKRFNVWTKQMIGLCSAKRYDEHEKMIHEILELKTYLDNIFPLNGETFIIDAFQVGAHRVVTEHYFSPQPFYSNASITSLRKHIKFTVLVADEVIRRYFLESTEYRGLNYVLGSSSPDYRVHRQLRQYLTTRPTYELMKDGVIEDLTVGGPTIASSFGNRVIPFDKYT